MSGAPVHAASLTCFVADGHPPVVESLTELLGATPGIELVGHAAEGPEALALILELRPAVAVVDLDMPGLDGIELARRLAASDSGCAIVIYCERVDQSLAVEALGAGVLGFVLKSSPLEEVPRAVRAAGDGSLWVDPVLELQGPAPTSLLTRREREVLALLADGMRNEEVAQRLSISSLTVSTHVKHAMEKLKASSRTEAVANALRQSLIA